MTNFLQFHTDYQTMALTLAGMHTNNKNKPMVQFNSNQVYLYRAFHIQNITAMFMAEMYIFATLNIGMDFSMI